MGSIAARNVIHSKLLLLKQDLSVQFTGDDWDTVWMLIYTTLSTCDLSLRRGPFSYDTTRSLGHRLHDTLDNCHDVS
jgi:hypothetical protein